MTDAAIADWIVREAKAAYDRADTATFGTEARIRAAVAAALDTTAMQVKDWHDPAFEMHGLAAHIRTEP